jgi:hypothetical protein
MDSIYLTQARPIDCLYDLSKETSCSIKDVKFVSI